jgi:hypothetical protein
MAMEFALRFLPARSAKLWKVHRMIWVGTGFKHLEWKAHFFPASRSTTEEVAVLRAAFFQDGNQLEISALKLDRS